jgi:hypothetical protein
MTKLNIFYLLVHRQEICCLRDVCSGVEAPNSTRNSLQQEQFSCTLPRMCLFCQVVFTCRAGYSVFFRGLYNAEFNTQSGSLLSARVCAYTNIQIKWRLDDEARNFW